MLVFYVELGADITGMLLPLQRFFIRLQAIPNVHIKVAGTDVHPPEARQFCGTSVGLLKVDPKKSGTLWQTKSLLLKLEQSKNCEFSHEFHDEFPSLS